MFLLWNISIDAFPSIRGIEPWGSKRDGGDGGRGGGKEERLVRVLKKGIKRNKKNKEVS